MSTKLDYDEISPITGNKSVLVEEVYDNVYQKICVESGFYTQTDWEDGSDQVDNYEETITDHNIDHKVVDENGLVWYPYMLTTRKSTMYADNFNGEFSWFVCALSSEPSEDNSIKISIDQNKSKVFNKDKFEEALSEFYILETR